MQRFKRWGLVALLVLLGMEILTIAPKRLGSSKDSTKPTPQEASKASPSTVSTTLQVMHGVHLVETSLGRKEWELDADDAQGFKDKGTWKLQGVHVKFFGDKNSSTYSVKGDSGTIQTETKDMEINGNVLTTTSEGYVFKTTSVSYRAKSRVLSTASHVDIIGPKDKDGQFELSGTGFNANLESSLMEIKKDVRAVKSIPPDRLMNIRSVFAKVYGKTSEAHFENQVQVDIDNVRMTGNQADFVYEKDTHQLKELLMVGNVKVTDQEHWASSQRAQVLFAKNEFILSGNPRVTQNDNELRGEEIRFLDGGKEIKVIKAKARMEDNRLNPPGRSSSRL